MYANRAIALIIFTLLLCGPGMAQVQDSVVQHSLEDSSRADYVNRMKKMGQRAVSTTIQAFSQDKIELRQDEIIEEIKKITQQAKDYLKRGIDTGGIRAEMARMNSWYPIAVDGVFTNQGSAQTYRNLGTTAHILEVILADINQRKNQVNTFQRDLINFRVRLDSLASDSLLYLFPQDSVALVKYLKKIYVLDFEVKPADSALNRAIAKAQDLQTQISFMSSKLAADLEEIDAFQRGISLQTLDKEFAYLWEHPASQRAIFKIISFSLAKGKLAFLFYARDNAGRMVLVISILLAATFYLRSLRKIYSEKGLLHPNMENQLVLRYPALSATMIILNVFQFIFPDPPFLFSAFCWIISCISVTFIFHQFITKYWMRLWLAMVVLFLLATPLNLLLQASRPERWAMLAVSFIGCLTALFVLLNGRRGELREKWLVFFLWVVVVFEAGSMISNITGRYNLAKTLMTAGFMNIVIGVLFLWTVRLINEALALASQVYTRQERRLFYINYEKLGKRAPGLFYFFLVIGWFILIGRNFYVFKLISQPALDFLYNERSIGSFSFTVESLLTFFGILALSVIISRIVSFFASDNENSSRQGEAEGISGIGSWLLLVRIAIISIGLFIAFAAAGIPMDRITIILGALGVGIGFGLQGLVSNLVSGLIIAFEKPVNVGDIIEIAGKAGTVQAIGFRSSVIATWDGAEVVMPNGELLNAHLVNWTLSHQKRRMEIIVGVAYGTDLERARQIISERLAADNRILAFPEPSIMFQEFGKSSIDIRILFWVARFGDGLPVKSDTILAIDRAFREQGIVIPFPQQDLHVRMMPAAGNEGRGEGNS